MIGFYTRTSNNAVWPKFGEQIVTNLIGEI
jgi:hypothetical protein